MFHTTIVISDDNMKTQQNAKLNNPNKSKLVPDNNHSKQTTRGSAIADEPHVSGTLHWRLSK